MSPVISIAQQNLINLIFFQSIWFATVLGVARDTSWFGAAGLLLFLVVHHFISPTARSDFRVAAIAVATGAVVETIVVQADLITYYNSFPSTEFAPVWILILWANLALTLNGCLSWLHDRYLLAALLGAIGGALSYIGGIKLGAATSDASLLTIAVSFGLVFAVVTPALLWLAKKLAGPTSAS